MVIRAVLLTARRTKQCLVINLIGQVLLITPSIDGKVNYIVLSKKIVLYMTYLVPSFIYMCIIY